MNNYLFYVLVTLSDDSDDENDYIEIGADNIRQARKKFAEHAAERYAAVADWCLLAVYRQI